MGSSPVLHPEIWSAHRSSGSVRPHLVADHCCHRGSGVERGIPGLLFKNIEYNKLKWKRIMHSINVVLSWLYKRPKALTFTRGEVEKSCRSAVFGDHRVCTVALVIWVLHWRGQRFRRQQVPIHIDSLQVNSFPILGRYWPRGQVRFLSQMYAFHHINYRWVTTNFWQPESAHISSVFILNSISIVL